MVEKEGGISRGKYPRESRSMTFIQMGLFNVLYADIHAFLLLCGTYILNRSTRAR